MLLDHMSISKLTPKKIVDYFVGDMLMPTTNVRKVMSSAELYKTFELYCDANGIGNPVSVHSFGRYLCNRFQRFKKNNTTWYFCEYKDDVLYEEAQQPGKKINGRAKYTNTIGTTPQLGSDKN